MFPENDLEFEEYPILETDGISITTEDGTLGFPKDSPVQPKVGMTARFYGQGFGYTVRGLFLDGQRVFYRSPKEQEVEDIKRHQLWEEENKRRELEPKNPDPQIVGFEWIEEMGEISGFHAGYEKTCRTMVSQGCKWWSEHLEIDPLIRGYGNIYGIVSPENEDAKKLEAAMMAGIDDCTGAMHQAVLSHIFAWKHSGSKVYQL